MEYYSVPILFVCFKRPQVALKSFEKIKSVHPKRLYIVSDGPRGNVENEISLVNETRQLILKQIDWECELHTCFREENYGCSKSVSEGVNWLFTKEEYGIILEDDCVAQDSFFQFMEEMLLKYKDDQRISVVDGSNGVESHVEIPWSYCFSKYKQTNGWGTWKRAWNQMDLNMSWRNTAYEDSIIKNMGYCAKDIKYWKYKLKLIDANEVSAWDWQWYFTTASFNQLAIVPKINLISNIGFGDGATHTTWGGIPDSYKATKELSFPLVHPDYIMPYTLFDKAYYRRNNSFFYTIMRYTPLSLKHFVKKLILIK